MMLALEVFCGIISALLVFFVIDGVLLRRRIGEMADMLFGRLDEVEGTQTKRIDELEGILKGVAQLVMMMNKATVQMVQIREPKLSEVEMFARKHGLFLGFQQEILHKLGADGYVVISAERWRDIVEHLHPGDPGNMSVRRWLERGD